MHETHHPLEDKALGVASVAHEGQFRKTTGEPYITHPEAVANILKEYGASEDVVAAALLHDVLEDAPDVYSRDDMLRDFNPHIVGLVDCVTEQKYGESGQPISWLERKQAYIKVLDDAPEEALLVSLADKIHNLGSVLDDLEIQGKSVWKNFHSSPLQQLWYYTTLSELFRRRLGAENQLVKQLAAQCDQFEQVLSLEQAEGTSEY